VNVDGGFMMSSSWLMVSPIIPLFLQDGFISGPGRRRTLRYSPAGSVPTRPAKSGKRTLKHHSGTLGESRQPSRSRDRQKPRACRIMPGQTAGNGHGLPRRHACCPRTVPGLRGSTDSPSGLTGPPFPEGLQRKLFPEARGTCLQSCV